MPYEWTPERTNRLKTLWREGMSAREIAGKIGSNLTRNAVIGKANRLGLSGNLEHGSKSVNCPQKILPQKLLPRKKCQWPFGHPDEANFHFCGALTFQTSPYCREHCLLAYRRVVITKTVQAE